ncbi:unnamed protein product, partial [Notodromas monacha]
MKFLESCEVYFGSKDLYEILDVKKTANEKQLKKAYYKLSLAVHPDRAPPEKKEHATKCFQVLSKIMSVLSDKDKKAIYDETGVVSDDDDEGISWEDNDWTSYWRLLFKPLTMKDIDEFFKTYRGSEEEQTDLIKCYVDAKGDWDVLWQTHKGYRGIDDEERLKDLIQTAVDGGEVEAYDAFFKEPKKKTLRRHKKMMKEAEAAEACEEPENDLAVMIAANAKKREQAMSSLIAGLEAKYCNKKGPQKKKQKTKYRSVFSRDCSVYFAILSRLPNVKVPGKIILEKMSVPAVSISVEAPVEHRVQEITFEGVEVRQNPPSMSENLTKLAQKIDFFEADEDSTSKDETEVKEEPVPLTYPWESIRSKLMKAFDQATVLLDIMAICREKKYMILDPVAQEAPPRAPIIQMLAKKKGFAAAADILQRGADKLKNCQSELARTRGIPNFHTELLRLRQHWRLKKTGNSIVGDLSYNSAAARWQSGVFEVLKTEEADGGTVVNSGTGPHKIPPALKVVLPPELECETYMEVVVHKDQETWASVQVNLLSPNAETQAPGDLSWQKKLENAQNVLFCKELFRQLAREAVCLPTHIPHMVVGNRITASLFPSIQLIITLNQVSRSDTGTTTTTTTNPRNPDHNHVLEHSLHQLLWDAHHKMRHQTMPHPSFGPIGIPVKRRDAGPTAASRASLKNLGRTESLLEQVIKQARHVVLRMSTMFVIDNLAKEVKDPFIVAHWNALNSPTVNITSCGYEALSRTSLVISVGETSLKAICKDGRVMTLSIEPQELRALLLCQIAQHQVTAVQTLAKCHGWIVVSSSTFLGGVGAAEPLGNPSSCVLSSPRGGYKLLAVKCVPKRDFRVSVAVVARDASLESGTGHAMGSEDSDAEEELEADEVPEVTKFEFDLMSDEPMDFDDLTRDLNFAPKFGGAAKRALVFGGDRKGGSGARKRRLTKGSSSNYEDGRRGRHRVYGSDLRHDALREVLLDKLDGRNNLSKIELIMACLAGRYYVGFHFMFQMVMKSGRVNLSLWAGPLLLASFLTSESLPDLGLIEIGQGRRLKKDISDKAQWKRGTLRFRGDPRLSADVVHPELGFLPEDIQWLQGTLDDDYLWASSVPKIPGKETLPKNLTVFQPGRSDPAFFPDQDYWIHILFKNVPEELSQNLVHDLTSRLERAHEFAFKRRRDLYPGIGQVKVIKREITNNVAVTMLKISKETEDEVEAAYSLRRDGKPVLSRSAVIELNDLTDPELDFIFYPYALERLTSERRQAVFQESPESSHMAYVILGVVGAAMFVAFLVALMFFVWMKGVKTGEEEETQRGRKNRRVESGELKLPVFEEHQVARVDLGFEPGESDDGKPQVLYHFFLYAVISAPRLLSQ